MSSLLSGSELNFVESESKRLVDKIMELLESEHPEANATGGHVFVQMLALHIVLLATAGMVDEDPRVAAALRLLFEDTTGAKWPGSGA